MVIIYLLSGAAWRLFLLETFFWGVGGRIGALNTCTKMPFLPQKLAA